MATVTGYLAQFGITLMPYVPKLEFIPSSAAVTGSGYIVVANPRVADIAADGSFSVTLLPNLETSPATYYTARITWLNGEGVPIGQDTPDWKITVPAEGGNITDMTATPPTRLEVYVGETNDLTYGFWYQPSTTILRSNP